MRPLGWVKEAYYWLLREQGWSPATAYRLAGKLRSQGARS